MCVCVCVCVGGWWWWWVVCRLDAQEGCGNRDQNSRNVGTCHTHSLKAHQTLDHTLTRVTAICTRTDLGPIALHTLSSRSANSGSAAASAPVVGYQPAMPLASSAARLAAAAAASADAAAGLDADADADEEEEEDDDEDGAFESDLAVDDDGWSPSNEVSDVPERGGCDDDAEDDEDEDDEDDDDAAAPAEPRSSPNVGESSALAVAAVAAALPPFALDFLVGEGAAASELDDDEDEADDFESGLAADFCFWPCSSRCVSSTRALAAAAVCLRLRSELELAFC